MDQELLEKPAQRNISEAQIHRAVASSTAIETGHSTATLEQRLRAGLVDTAGLKLAGTGRKPR